MPLQACFSTLCGSEPSARTLQMYRQNRRGLGVTISRVCPCFSSAAGSRLPSTPGACQIFDPVLAQIEAQRTSPSFPGGKTLSVLCGLACAGEVGVCRCACTCTGALANLTPPPHTLIQRRKKKLFVVFVRDKQEQLMRGKSRPAE